MSGLLDVWTTVFRADTDDLDKGIKKSDEATENLITTLKGVKGAGAEAGSSFGAFATGALASLTAALSVGALIHNAVESAAEIGRLSQTAEALDVSIESLDAFGRAAQQAGGDAEGARDSLTDMAEKIGEAFSDTESGAAKAFQGLGIQVKDANGKAKDAITGFLDLASAVEGLDKSAAVFKVKELGITDNRSVELLLKGRKELERMIQAQKDMGVITKENAEVAKRYTESMNAFKGTLERVGMSVNSALLPALTKIVEWLSVAANWLAEHKDLVIGFFGAIAAVVATIYVPAMISAAIATLAATWPIIAMIAIVGALAAAFALAYDDVMNFLEGNDSLIGQIFEKYPAVKEMVMQIIGAFKFMGDVIAQVFQTLVTGFKQVIDFVMGGVNQIKSGVSTVSKFFGIKSDTPEDKKAAALGEVGSEARARLAAPDHGRGPEDVPMPTTADNVAATRQGLATAASSPLNSSTSNAISNSTSNVKKETNVQTGDIIIQTQATDAQGIAKAGAGGLKDQLKQMDSEFSTGRDR